MKLRYPWNYVPHVSIPLFFLSPTSSHHCWQVTDFDFCKLSDICQSSRLKSLTSAASVCLSTHSRQLQVALHQYSYFHIRLSEHKSDQGLQFFSLTKYYEGHCFKMNPTSASKAPSVAVTPPGKTRLCACILYSIS